MRLDERANRRVELTLFFVAWATFAYFYQASDHSTAARFDLMRSIVERRTLWIDGFCGWNTADIINFGPHIYSVKAPGGSLTGLAPWIFSTGLMLPLVHNHAPLFWALTTWLTIVFSTSLLVALLTVIIYRTALFFDASCGRAAAIALIGAFGTILFPYATEMTGEPIAAACLFASFYLIATHEHQRDLYRIGFAGFLAGWGVLNHYPAALIAIGLACYAMFKLERWGDLALFAAGAGAVALVLFAYNRFAFGNYLFLSYEAYSMPGNQYFQEQRAGFVGVTYPRLRILWDILIDPQRGLLFCNPVLLLSIPGLACLARKREWRAEFVLVAFTIIAYALFNASFGESIVSWGGGTATGPRQLTPAVPFMVLTLAFLPAAWDWLLGGLGALSVFYMLIATAVEPHFPYEYNNPIWDFAMPAYFRGDLAYNSNSYFDRGPVAGDSVAFNLGKLIGLPGALQLLPLALLWIAGAWRLLGLVLPSIEPRRPRSRDRMIGAAVSIAIAAIFVPPLAGGLVRRAALAPDHGLLGRYFTGLSPDGSPPHLERVDRQLDFADVAELGALPSPSRVTWSGAIQIDRAGIYRFSMQVDDSGWLKIDDRYVIPDPGQVTRPQSFGAVYLAAGRHRIEVGQRNLAGDAALRLFWHPPGGATEIVPETVLYPERADASE